MWCARLGLGTPFVELLMSSATLLVASDDILRDYQLSLLFGASLDARGFAWIFTGRLVFA